MPIGRARYDEACGEARMTTEAEGVLLIVFGGNKGNGFSAQIPQHLLMQVPEILRYVAEQIQKDLSQGNA